MVRMAPTQPVWNILASANAGGQMGFAVTCMQTSVAPRSQASAVRREISPRDSR